MFQNKRFTWFEIQNTNKPTDSKSGLEKAETGSALGELFFLVLYRLIYLKSNLRGFFVTRSKNYFCLCLFRTKTIFSSEYQHGRNKSTRPSTYPGALEICFFRAAFSIGRKELTYLDYQYIFSVALSQKHGP